MRKRKSWGTGWWVSASAEGDSPHWERFILPYLSFIPWHKSTLASIPDFDTWAVTLQCGWWSWRLRFTVGYTLRLPTQLAPDMGQAGRSE